MFYLKLYSLQRLHILGQYFSISSLFVRHVPFVQVVPHFGLKFLHSPVKSLSMTVRAICSLRPFFPIDLLFILTAKILVAPTLAASALCAWSSRRVGLLSYHVTTAKMIKKICQIIIVSQFSLRRQTRDPATPSKHFIRACKHVHYFLRIKRFQDLFKTIDPFFQKINQMKYSSVTVYLLSACN